jgi:hypothetical protein
MIRVAVATAILGLVLAIALLSSSSEEEISNRVAAATPTARPTLDYLITHDPCMNAGANGRPLQRAASFDLTNHIVGGCAPVASPPRTSRRSCSSPTGIHRTGV